MSGPPILVSACLAGRRCRYDGQTRGSASIQAMVARGEALPICPEELGGLPTPRPRAALEGGDGEGVWRGEARVIADGGQEVTEAFREGALAVLRIARQVGARRAILKQHSPSCGVGSVGTPAGRRPGRGVTAALLEQEGLEVSPDEAPGPWGEAAGPGSGSEPPAV